MSTTTIVILSILGVIAVGMVGACGLHAKHHGPGDRADWVVKRISKKLDLNSDQQQKLVAVKEKLMAVRSEVKNKRGDMRAELRELISGPTLDRELALTTIRARTQSIEEHAPQFVATLGDFYDSLLPEQQQQLKDHMEHHGHWYGRCR